jgi:hypothetical protein
MHGIKMKINKFKEIRNARLPSLMRTRGSHVMRILARSLNTTSETVDIEITRVRVLRNYTGNYVLSRHEEQLKISDSLSSQVLKLESSINQ